MTRRIVAPLLGLSVLWLGACAYTPSQLREDAPSQGIAHELEARSAALAVAGIELGICGKLDAAERALSIESDDGDWIVTIGAERAFPDDGDRHVVRVYDASDSRLTAFAVGDEHHERVERVLLEFQKVADDCR